MHHKRTESQANRINDVIVIGAGLSGLSAAKVCHDRGLKVLVLEARDRVGGLTLSDDNGADLGGAHFIQDHRNIFNLIAELGLKCQADVPSAAISGARLFYSNATKSKFRCDHHQHPATHQSGADGWAARGSQVPFASRYNVLARLDFIATKERINRLCSEVDLNEPWNTRNARQLDSQTFRHFLERTCYTSHVRNFFLHFLVPINLTNEAEDCSLLYALRLIRAWGGIERCIGMEGGGSSGGGCPTSRVAGGSQLISTRLSQQIGEERVLLNKPVHTIDQQTNSELVSVIAKDGSRFEALRVIVALAPNLQTAITFRPQIPLKSQLNHRFPAGLCTKVILYYDRAYWYDSGLNGNLNVLDHERQRDDESVGRRSRDFGRRKALEYRRSIRKTSSSSENRLNDDVVVAAAGAASSSASGLVYASNNSLLGAPPVVVGGGGGGGATGSGTGAVVDIQVRNNVMLKETKESFYPKSGQSILDEDYCPVSFVTPDYSRGQPSLIGHICGAAWIKYHQIEKIEDRIALVAKSYANILHPSLGEPLSWKELNWVGEDYSRGSYTSVMGPGTLTKYGRAMKAPFGRIAFASTELSTYWPGTMEGAIRSGRKAALKILRDLQRADICSEDIVDDEEVPMNLGDSFIERHAHKLLYLTHLALNLPTLVLLAAAVGFSFQKISLRCSIGV